jgi:L-ascorbate metabolism protein UlaG (beta-lactamase superfamily)
MTAAGQLDSNVAVTFVGTATIVLQAGPFTVLTDPNFLHRGQWAWLGHGLVTKRLTEPALAVADLPDLDGILLSHLHGDHWDRVARRELDPRLPVWTTPHAALRLHARHGFRRAQGLRTWETTVLRKAGHVLTVTALPGLHAPGLVRYLLPPVMGSLLELTDAAGHLQWRGYITGDTLVFDGIAAIAARFGSIDTVVVHLGGTTLPGGLVVTLDGEGGAELVRTIGPAEVVPVHYDDYKRFRSPLGDFTAALRARGLEHLLHHVAPGQTAFLGRG